MARNHGKWTVGRTGCVVSDLKTRPDKLPGFYWDNAFFLSQQEITAEEKSEVDYYGGYILAESIPSNEDALIIAAAPDLLDACKQILNGLSSFDQVEYFNGLKSARLAIDKAEPKPIMIPEFSEGTINRIMQIINK